MSRSRRIFAFSDEPHVAHDVSASSTPGALSCRSKRDAAGKGDEKGLWDDEVEIYDKEGQETVEISLVYEAQTG